MNIIAARREQRARPGPVSRRAIHLKRTIKKKLRRLIRAGTTENRLVYRARMVLLRAEGLSIAEVARRLEMRHHTVGLWCDRFMENGIEGLHDQHRSGRPRSLSLQTSSSL